MTATNDSSRVLREFYTTLFAAFGPQYWWPGETRDEIIIGAILTQNTAWTNVARAITQLRKHEALTLRAIHELDESRLADWIKPAGTYRVKARRLKALVHWFYDHFDGDLDRVFATPLAKLRPMLLSVSGVGPETADAILLYAGDIPTFVVDAYTRRILRRHDIIDGEAGYEHVKRLFEHANSPDAHVYGEYHALLVALAKRHCKSTADCDDCPLRDWPHDASK